MRIDALLNEVINVRRLTPKAPPPETEVDELTGIDDLPYTYDDEDPMFDFGDAPEPDDEYDVSFGDNTGDESDALNQALDQPAGSQNLNQAGLGSASASTPQGQSLEADLAAGGEQVSSQDNTAKQLADTASDDPNKQGMLRKVKGAKLIYKRQTENGSYEELWAYNITSSNAADSFKRRRSILAGTDIPPNKTTSPDGSQTYEIWTTNNAELIKIKGLQN
jgi:hypothetical protein